MAEALAQAKILIHRPAAAVFDAFADPAVLTKFWFPQVSGRLETGARVSWFTGTGPDAIEISVRVIAAERPHRILIEWGDDTTFTTVHWSFKTASANRTILTITERGYTGDPDEVIQQALDSTGGFNQVIVAAKALLEHQISINIVSDHVA